MIWGIKNRDGVAPTIAVDSLGVTGFQLGGQQTLHSKDIFWETYYAMLRHDDPSPDSFWELDGGGLKSMTNAYAIRTQSAGTFVFRNDVVLDGSACTWGLFGIPGGGDVYTSGPVSLGSKIFYSATPATTTIHADSGLVLNPGAAAGVMSLTVLPYDLSAGMEYTPGNSADWQEIQPTPPRPSTALLLP